jgi:hypothetical protein
LLLAAKQQIPRAKMPRFGMTKGRLSPHGL